MSTAGNFGGCVVMIISRDRLECEFRFDQLHRGRAGDRFGHRGDPKHGVGRHRIVLREVTLAERAFIDQLFAGRSDSDDARNFFRFADAAKGLINLVDSLAVPPVVS
jgi:hypothetical protein